MEKKAMSTDDIFQQRVLLELQLIRDRVDHIQTTQEGFRQEMTEFRGEFNDFRTEMRAFRVTAEGDLEILRKSVVHWRGASDQNISRLARRVGRIEKHLGLD